METRLIYNIITEKCVVLDSDVQLIPNLIEEKFINYELLNLPKNVFSNIQLFLGNDYIDYTIDIERIKKILFKNKHLFSNNMNYGNNSHNTNLKMWYKILILEWKN